MDTIEIRLSGRIDSNNAQKVEQEMMAQLNGRLPAEVVLDAQNLSYISSAGLRVLLSAHKAMAGKGGMKVKNVNEIVSEVFEVTGFADILNIE